MLKIYYVLCNPLVIVAHKFVPEISLIEDKQGNKNNMQVFVNQIENKIKKSQA